MQPSPQRNDFLVIHEVVCVERREMDGGDVGGEGAIDGNVPVGDLEGGGVDGRGVAFGGSVNSGVGGRGIVGGLDVGGSEVTFSALAVGGVETEGTDPRLKPTIGVSSSRVFQLFGSLTYFHASMRVLLERHFTLAPHPSPRYIWNIAVYLLFA